MDYKIMISLDKGSGLWEAHKEYGDGTHGVSFMFAHTSECLKFKLEEDGEDKNNIYQGE